MSNDSIAILRANTVGVHIPADADRKALTAARWEIVARMYEQGEPIPAISAAIGRNHPQGAATIVSDLVKRGRISRRGRKPKAG
jgi:hypothetical protein